jgi:hypothetical protein
MCIVISISIDILTHFEDDINDKEELEFTPPTIAVIIERHKY